MFSGIPFVGNMGYTAAVAVLVAVTAAVTLLPALLGALGERIHSLRVQLGKTHPDDHQPHGWARWARGVVNRPWRSLVASVAFLLVLALPVLDLELGASDNGELPKSTTARQAYDLMTEGFGPGSNGPLLIGVELGSPAKPDQSQINQVNQKQDQLNQQIAEQEQQLEATGVPAGAGSAAGRAADRVAVAAARPAEAARRVAGHRHAPDRPRERDQEGPGHQVRLAGDRRQEGHGRGLHGDRRPPHPRTRTRSTPSTGCATR